MAYPLAVGIDTANLVYVRVSLKIAIPGGSTQSGVSGGGGGQGNQASYVTTAESDSINSALNLIENYIGKQINLSHTKQIVISEDLARMGGLHRFIHGIIRGRQFRPTTNIFVCYGPADEFLKASSEIFTMNEAKYYELVNGSYTYTGFGVDSTVRSFYNSMESRYSQPVVALEAVNIYSSVDEFNLSNSTALQKGRDTPHPGDYKAGMIPRIGGPRTEIMGIALFRNDMMVGTMDGEGAKFYLITSGKFQTSFLSVPDPIDEGSFIVLRIRQNRSPSYTVKIEDDKPHINLKINLEGDFASIQSSANYEDIGNIAIAEKATEEFLKEGIMRYLEDTAKKYNSDINGFGAKARMLFPNWEKWDDYNWLEKYKDSVFNLKVSFKIRRTGLLVRSLMTEGEEEH